MLEAAPQHPRTVPRGAVTRLRGLLRRLWRQRTEKTNDSKHKDLFNVRIYQFTPCCPSWKTILLDVILNYDIIYKTFPLILSCAELKISMM